MACRSSLVGKSHLLTIAPARQGKGTCVVIPNLLHYAGSVFVTDPKGELAAVTANHRRERFGHKIFFLNPWHLHGLSQSRFNPLTPLIEMFADPLRHHELGDAVRGLALLLIPEPVGGDKNQYFRDAARNLLEGLILYFVTRGRPIRCTLPQLWRLVKSTDMLEMAFRDMAESDALDGIVAAYGQEFLHQFKSSGGQFSDFRTTVSNALQIFRPGGPLAEAVSHTDFSFDDLKAEDTTVYCDDPRRTHWRIWNVAGLDYAAGHQRGCETARREASTVPAR